MRSCPLQILLGSSLFFDRVHLVSLTFYICFTSLFLLTALANSMEEKIFVDIKFGLLFFYLFYFILIYFAYPTSSCLDPLTWFRNEMF